MIYNRNCICSTLSYNQ